MYKFWMVYTPQGSAPAKQHSDEASALAEAGRLIGIHPTREFYVLEATKVIKTKEQPVIIEHLENAPTHF